MRAVLIGCVLALAPSGLARADAIGIPDDLVCPAGASLSVNHAGHWCVPLRTCSSDADCEASDLCGIEPIAVCVATETYTAGGRLATDRPTTHSIQVVRGPCDPSCSAPAACDSARRCVPRPAPSPSPVAGAPTTPPSPSTESSGGCHATPGVRGHVGLIALAFVALVGACRRRAT